MVGKPFYKIYCESFTRGSNYTKQCRCKGYFQKTSKKYRCKFHAGMSEGPTSLEGKIKAYKNLKPFKNKTEEQLKQWIQKKLLNV
tara:strand:+ start:516 stop:770 length:255 start_codon:yes stop_codon:yes gene_type:complete